MRSVRGRLRWRDMSGLTIAVSMIAAAALGGGAAAGAGSLGVGAAVPMGVAAGLLGLAAPGLWQMGRERRAREAAWARACEEDASNKERARHGTDDGLVQLLDPRRLEVPFNDAHAPLKQRLAAWCVSGTVAVAVVSGRAGMGKTRLALQLTDELAASGWRCGWVKPGQSEAAVRAGLDLGTSVLLVIDDADIRQDLVPALTEAVRAEALSLRLLLLTRVPWLTNVVDDLRKKGDHDVATALSHAERVTVGPLGEDEDTQQRAFRRAAHVFARRYGAAHRALRTMQVTGLTPQTPALLLHAAALVAAQDVAKNPQFMKSMDVSAVLTRLVTEEEKHWTKTWIRPAEKSGVKGLMDTPAGELQRAAANMLRRALVAAVLAGAADEKDAVQLLSSVPGLKNADPPVHDALVLWLRAVYPQVAGGGYLAPRLPSHVAEHLAVAELTADPTVAPALGQLPDTARVTHVLTVLARAAVHNGRAPACLTKVIVADPGRLLPIAMDIARSYIGPVDQAIAHAVVQANLDRTRARALLDSVPTSTQVLAITAAALARRVVEVTDDTGLWASAVAHMADRLSALGLYEEALAALARAVDEFKMLAKTCPHAFCPLLAAALAALALVQVHLAGGRRKQLVEALATARMAVALSRDLAEPDAKTYARSLFSMMCCLRALPGREQDAADTGMLAVDILRRLAAIHPDEINRYQLAVTLKELADCLIKLPGKEKKALEAAVETVHIFRELAATRPDLFRELLPTSLISLANCLRNVDEEEASKRSAEAAEIFRELAAMHPDVYRAKLAVSLHSLAFYLARLPGRERDGLTAAAEAILEFRRLPPARLEAQRPDFAAVLLHQSRLLAKFSDRPGALITAREAAAEYRKLVESHPDAFAARLAVVEELRARLEIPGPNAHT